MTTSLLPRVLDRLRLIEKEVGALILALEDNLTAPTAAPPAAAGAAASERTVREGMLRNPYVGPIQRVTQRQVPARKGGTVTAYTLHTPAAPFETFNENWVRLACRAVRAHQPVTLYYSERSRGRYTNYDIKKLEAPNV